MLFDYIGIFLFFCLLLTFLRSVIRALEHRWNARSEQRVIVVDIPYDQTYVCLHCGATKVAITPPLCDSEHATPIVMGLFDPRRSSEYALLRHVDTGIPEQPIHHIAPQLGIPASPGPGQHLLYCPDCYMTDRGSTQKFCPNHAADAPVLMEWGKEEDAPFYLSMQRIIAPESEKITPPPDDR